MEGLILAIAFATIIGAAIGAYGGTERLVGMFCAWAFGLIVGALTSLLVGISMPFALATITVPFACLAVIAVNFFASDLRGYCVNAVAGAIPLVLLAYATIGISTSADSLVINLTLAAFGAFAGIGYRVGVKLYRFHSEPAFPIY